MIDRSIRSAEAAKLRELYEAKKSSEKEKGNTFNQVTIAKSSGWTQPNVSAYLKGAVELKEESALIFSSALEVPVSAFSQRIADKISRREMLSRNPMLNKTHVSYVPKINAETMNKIRNNLRNKCFIMPLSANTTPICKELSKNAFSYDLVDNSLSDKYPVGTTFIFDPFIDPSPTDMVLVGSKQKEDDYHIREYFVTEILDDGTERYELKACNPAYPVLKDNYEVLGVAVAVVNMLKP